MMNESTSRPEAQPGDLILARDCWIEAADGDVMLGLAERIGMSIFYGTHGLGPLLDQLKEPDRKPDPDNQPTNARSST